MSRPYMKVTFSDKSSAKKFVSKLIDDDTPMFSCSYKMVLVEFSQYSPNEIRVIAKMIDNKAEVTTIDSQEYKLLCPKCLGEIK